MSEVNHIKANMKYVDAVSPSEFALIEHLKGILANPEQLTLFDCSWESNYFWGHNQDQNLEWRQEVEGLNHRIAQANIPVRGIIGRYDLQGEIDNIYYPENIETTCWPASFFYTTVLEQAPFLNQAYRGDFYELSMGNQIKLFVSHMNHPKTHRMALMEVLIDNNAMQKGVVRFCNNTDAWRNLLSPRTMHHRNLSEFMEKILPYAPDIFSPYKYSPASSDTISRAYIIDPHYARGFIDIPPESHCEVNFITQKSCQPILWKKPFCILGSTQQNTILKNLGFELFDEIFDISNETDELVNTKIYQLKTPEYDLFRQHYDKLLKNLWQLDSSPESINDMRQKFHDKTEHNLNRYMQILFDDDMIPEYQAIRESFQVVGARNAVLQNPYFQRYIPVDKNHNIV